MVFRFFREIYCRIINHHSPHEVHFSNRQNEDGSCDGWANLVKCVMCKKVLLNQPDFIENNKNPLAQIYGVHGSSGSCTVNVEIIDGDTKIVNVYGGAYGGALWMGHSYNG